MADLFRRALFAFEIVVMFFAIAVVVFALLAIASACDLRTREIPDWISIAIAVVAIVGAIGGWLGLGIAWVIAGGMVGLLIGSLLFHYASLGGGDAKLIAALGLLVGPAGLLIVLFGMALAGGALSILAIVRGQRDYAYAPAITLGFIGYLGFVTQL